MPSKTRIAVLASGGGSNLQALLDFYTRLGAQRHGDVVLVASERTTAHALHRANVAGVSSRVIASRFSPDAPALAQLLRESSIELIVLAGFLQMIPPDVVAEFQQRIINVHPGPLPRFGGAGMYGKRVHQAVLEAGVPFSAATVHYVDEVYDRGPSIASWPVAVHANDDAHVLQARVLRAEHVLYPRVVEMIARGALPRLGRVLPVFDETLSAAQLGSVADTVLSS